MSTQRKGHAAASGQRTALTKRKLKEKVPILAWLSENRLFFPCPKARLVSEPEAHTLFSSRDSTRRPPRGGWFPPTVPLPRSRPAVGCLWAGNPKRAACILVIFPPSETKPTEPPRGDALECFRSTRAFLLLLAELSEAGTAPHGDDHPSPRRCRRGQLRPSSAGSARQRRAPAPASAGGGAVPAPAGPQPPRTAEPTRGTPRATATRRRRCPARRL